MKDDIRLGIEKMLKDGRAPTFIIAGVEAVYGITITREDISRIQQQIKKLADAQKDMFDEVCTDVKFYYIQYIEAKIIYSTLLRALGGSHSKFDEISASKKICDVYDRMFKALKDFKDAYFSAAREIKQNQGTEKFNTFLRFVEEMKQNVPDPSSPPKEDVGQLWLD
jgi:hypothetical protein